MKNLISQKAMVLANQLRRYEKLSLSDSLKYAWDFVRRNRDASLLTFKTKSEKVCKRLVYSDWSKFTTTTGTGRKSPEGLSLFADVAKVECGLPSIISTYHILSIS
jgi:hypothetical protein